jgi:hypothetical protein
MPEAKHPNLTDAFAAAAPRDRAAGLSGLLAPRERTPRAPEEEPSPAAAGAPRRPAAAVDAPTRTARRKATEPRPAAPTEDLDEIVNLPIYLPEELRQELLTLMPRGTTYADVLLEAFEGVDESTLAAYFTPTARVSASGMPLPAQKPNPGSGPQRQFRVRRAQLQWIEALSERVHAPNRSVLCVAALRLHIEDRNAKETR